VKIPKQAGDRLTLGPKSLRTFAVTRGKTPLLELELPPSCAHAPAHLGSSALSSGTMYMSVGMSARPKQEFRVTSDKAPRNARDVLAVMMIRDFPS
jgi:hypothetical protein